MGKGWDGFHRLSWWEGVNAWCIFQESDCDCVDYMFVFEIEVYNEHRRLNPLVVWFEMKRSIDILCLTSLLEIHFSIICRCELNKCFPTTSSSVPLC